MGFIVPGVNHSFYTTQKGVSQRAVTFNVSRNQARNFNRRYPHNLLLRDLKELDKLSQILKNSTRHRKTSYTRVHRLRLQRYLELQHDVFLYTGIRRGSLSKEFAIQELKSCIEAEGCKLLASIEKGSSLQKSNLLEAKMSSQMELIEGGSILLNNYLNNTITVDIEDYEDESNEDHYKYEPEEKIKQKQKIKMEEVEKEQEKSKLMDIFELRKTATLETLPTEILIRIFSYSNNIPNLALTCSHFNSFIFHHLPSIALHYITTRYVHRYSLSLDKDNNIDLVQDDLQQLENSHRKRLDEKIDDTIIKSSVNPTLIIKNDIKHTDNRYILKRYLDPNHLTVLSSRAFMSPYMSYQIMKALLVDHVIPSSSLLDLKEIFEDAMKEAKENYSNLLFYTLPKSLFRQFYNEHPIQMPYLDQSNPGNVDFVKEGGYLDKLRILTDLIVNKTRLNSTLEDSMFLIVSLAVRASEDTLESEFPIPVDILKSYILFALKEDIAANEDDQENIELQDDELLDRLKFSNADFLVLLVHESSKEIEDLLCRGFYGEHLKSDEEFWLRLKTLRESEIIEWLINRRISPDSWILNQLAM